MRQNRPKRQGFFLIIVLVVVAVATMAAYSFTDTMLAYDEASHLTSDHVQTQAAVDTGIDFIRLTLSQTVDQREAMGGIKENPQMFQAITVVPVTDGGRACNFSVIAPGLDETGRLGGVRFGLQNESARLNVNALITLDKHSSTLMAAVALTSALAGTDTGTSGGASADSTTSDSLASSLLMALPGMTAEAADSILDWLDEDDDPRPYGAELDYYSTLPTPYEPTNGPITSVEELLLVKGVTPNMLFGVDVNRNGVVDAAEQQNAVVDINSNAALGWSAYITVHALESNRRRDGSERINLNQDDVEALYDEITAVVDTPEYATYMAAYRLYGQPAANSLASAMGAAGETLVVETLVVETLGGPTAGIREAALAVGPLAAAVRVEPLAATPVQPVVLREEALVAITAVATTVAVAMAKPAGMVNREAVKCCHGPRTFLTISICRRVQRSS